MSEEKNPVTELIAVLEAQRNASQTQVAQLTAQNNLLVTALQNALNRVRELEAQLPKVGQELNTTETTPKRRGRKRNG